MKLRNQALDPFPETFSFCDQTVWSEHSTAVGAIADEFKEAHRERQRRRVLLSVQVADTHSTRSWLATVWQLYYSLWVKPQNFNETVKTKTMSKTSQNKQTPWMRIVPGSDWWKKKMAIQTTYTTIYTGNLYIVTFSHLHNCSGHVIKC